MNVWNGIESHPENAGSIVATIGNYDGVHLGHQAILHGVVEDARARGARSFLITFDPHPVAVVAPQRGQQLLQTRGQKLESLQATAGDTAPCRRNRFVMDRFYDRIKRIDK